MPGPEPVNFCLPSHLEGPELLTRTPLTYVAGSSYIFPLSLERHRNMAL